MENYENISIVISDVTKEYGSKKGIYGINTIFEQGRLNIITGANGSGKSTLFKCIMGLISYQGNIVKRKLRIGYAPEEYIMPLSMTVVDFLWSIGRIKGLSRDGLDENLVRYLNFFGLENYKYHPIAQLSHGMRQKVNLIQALVHEPKIIILDEPLAGLDIEMIPKFVKLLKEKAKTSLIIVSTHNQEKFNFQNKTIYRFEDGKLNVE